MGKPLLFEIVDKPATSCLIGICSAIWYYIQKKNIGYANVGLSYDTAMEGHHWRIITSAFSHISVIHLVFNMSALWSLGVVERLGHLGLGLQFYLHYTILLVHVLIQKFEVEYFRRVTAVGYSCVVFGWMTILSASFIGHLSGIIVGYSIAWGLIHGMNNYCAVSMLAWIVFVFVFSLKRSGAYDFNFIEIEPVTDATLPSVGFLAPGNGRTLQMQLGGAGLV
ncbi:RHOMBOID-like protein 13 [Ranunculus cassubicifolius]